MFNTGGEALLTNNHGDEPNLNASKKKNPVASITFIFEIPTDTAMFKSVLTVVYFIILDLVKAKKS